MKIVSLIARLLLGFIFVVFGLNGFLHFIPMGPLPAGPAGQFLVALTQSHYMSVIFIFEMICGVLLLVNRFVPLALTILGAIVANILLFHITMAPAGLPLALATFVLWSIVFASVRQHCSGIFIQKSTI
jgi:hypothetical protein